MNSCSEFKKKGKSNLNADTVYLDLEICPTGKLLDNTELYRHLFLQLYQLVYYFKVTFLELSSI